jgi:hypothetical protein
MAKSPSERYASAGDLAAASGNALAGIEADDERTRAAPVVPTPSARRRSVRRPLLAVAAFAAALAIAAVAVVVASRGSGGGAGTDDVALRTFVDRIENVLEQSADGRHEIGAALAAGFSCSISPRDAGRRIASVADNRQSILIQIGTLPTPTELADDVVTRLQRALQQSIEADRHYRDGFFAVPAGSRCPLPGNTGFVLAARSDTLATAAKRHFVRAFNPLARHFERKTWSPSGF